MVDTEFLSAIESTFYGSLPRLNPDDVTAAVLYALGTPEHTQVEHIFHSKSNFLEWNSALVKASRS